MSTSTTAMNESEEYYCFRVKDSELGVDNANIVIPRSYNFDLKKLRLELWKQFGVPRDRRIFYIDDDGDDVPIDSECEFHEALKLAKNAFVINTAIPLIVGPFHVPVCSDDEHCSGTNETCCPNVCSVEKESRGINNNPISISTEKNGASVSEPDSKFDKQKRPTRKMSSHQKKLDVRQCDESSEEQTESEDLEVPKELNASLLYQSNTVPPKWLTGYVEGVRQRDESSEEQTESEDIKVPKELNASLLYQSNTVPPLWFTEYMEAMKKDIISTITHEVVKNVTEMLNKRLDSLVYSSLKELGQTRSQSNSSLPKRHPRCSFDSNEKNQKRMRSQDEEQSSDASIERVDEPQNTANTAKDSQTEKDMISTISQEVVKEMTVMLNRIPLDPFKSVSSKKLGQSRSHSFLPLSERFTRYFDSQSSEKTQRKMRVQDGEQSSDDASLESTYGPRNADKLADISASILKDEDRKKRRHYSKTRVNTDNLSSDKEQSIQNNAQEDFVPRKNSPLQADPIPYDETSRKLENELRMSCSVTGHQILDEGHRPRDVWCCDNSDIEKTGFWSCDGEEEDDDAFEIIQMPTSAGRNESFARSEEPAADQRRHDSNRDSPSFELLSEPSSPTPMSFMNFNEEHFSTNEGTAEQQSLQFANTNPPTSSVYVVDIHGKIYNEHQLADHDDHVSADLEKRSGGVYSFVTETLPVQDTHCPKSSHSEQRSNERKKNPRDDVCGTCENASSLYGDVRNSHTSYLTVQSHCDSKTQCSCQSQTDLSDFTQSFHSHTTSVTDTTDFYTEANGSDRYGEQTRRATVPNYVREAATVAAAAAVAAAAKDVRKAATTTATTVTMSSTPKNDHEVDGGCVEETKPNERQHNNTANYPKYGSHSSTPRGTSVHQSRRTRKDAEEKSRKRRFEPICPFDERLYKFLRDPWKKKW